MSFDRLAPHYNWLETLLAGKTLQRCRTAFLDDFASARSILLIGEGHGRFLPALLERNSKARVRCLDQSAGMFKLARERLDAGGFNGSNVSFEIQDIFQFEPNEQFDAIGTHFFLDCFTAEQMEKIIPKIASWIVPNGFWHISDFQVPERFFAGMRARLILALAYGFFRFTTRLPARQIVSPENFITSCGLQRGERHEFDFGLLYSELWRKH